MTETLAELDWDKWRAEYDSLTFDEMQDFYKEVARLYPGQQSYEPFQVLQAIEITGHVDHVVELGGWDGKLARDMLTLCRAKSWTNYDIAPVPQDCTYDTYEFVLLEDWIWEGALLRGDMFVSCHTIEHLSLEHLRRLFSILRTKWVHLQAPLQPGPTDWTGYVGSHKLEVGWEGVNRELSKAGYARFDWDLKLWRRR